MERLIKSVMHMRQAAIKALAAGLVILLNSCDTGQQQKIRFTAASADSSAAVLKLSLKDLRKDYVNLHGKKIETEGILWFQFENVSICPGFGSLRKKVRECFWLDFHNQLNLNDSLMQKVSGSRFIIRGTVDSSDKGHFGMYLGTIKNIFYVQQR